MVCPRRPLMTQVQHWAKMAQTDHVTLELWPWRSWRLWLVWVVVFHLHTKFEVRRPCRSECMWALMGPVTLTFSFDLETSMRVASKVGNLSSKFGHARPLGSRIIRYVRDGRTDWRTKATLIAPFPMGGGIITKPCSPRPVVFIDAPYFDCVARDCRLPSSSNVPVWCVYIGPSSCCTVEIGDGWHQATVVYLGMCLSNSTTSKNWTRFSHTDPGRWVLV